MTISSPPDDRPMALWVWRNGNRGSAPELGKKSSHRNEVAPRIPISESMNTMGMPARLSATKTIASGTSGATSTLSRPKQTTHRIAASTMPPATPTMTERQRCGPGADRTRSSDRAATYRYWMTMNAYPTGIDRIAVHIGTPIAGLT
jgi:hypothetical protein